MKKNAYTEEELQEFSGIILQKIEKAKVLISSLRSYHNGNGTDDTYRQFQCLEEGQFCLSKEEIALLSERQESFILDLNKALARIGNKTYGICRVTGELIPKERLRCVPHATLTVGAKLNGSKINNGNGVRR